MLFFVCYVGYGYAMCNFTPNKLCYVMYGTPTPSHFFNNISSNKTTIEHEGNLVRIKINTCV